MSGVINMSEKDNGMNGKGVLADEEILDIDATMRFNFRGEMKTLKRTGFAINNLMRKINKAYSDYNKMPMTTDKEVEAMEKAGLDLANEIQEFLKLTVEPLSDEELKVASMDDFNLVARQLNILSQRANGFTFEQIKRMSKAEAEMRIEAMESGKVLENLLERMENAANQPMDQTQTSQK
jgi:hypothetical protein